MWLYIEYGNDQDTFDVHLLYCMYYQSSGARTHTWATLPTELPLVGKESNAVTAHQQGATKEGGYLAEYGTYEPEGVVVMSTPS